MFVHGLQKESQIKYKQIVACLTYTSRFSATEMDKIYANSVEFGRFYTYLMFIIALIVAVVMLWWSWAIRSQNAKYKGVVKGTVTEAGCTAVSKDLMSCAVNAVYTVNNKEFMVTDFDVRAQSALKKGDMVRLNYNTSNPADVVSTSALIPNSWSTSLVYVAFLIVLFAVFKLWLTRKYSFAAAGSAVGGVMSTFKL